MGEIPDMIFNVLKSDWNWIAIVKVDISQNEWAIVIFLEITLILWQVSTFGSLEIMQVGCILNYQIMISLEKTRKKLDLGISSEYNSIAASSAKLEKAASYKNVYVYQIIFDLLIMTFFSLDHDFRYTNSNCQKMMWFFLQ